MRQLLLAICLLIFFIGNLYLSFGYASDLKKPIARHQLHDSPHKLKYARFHKKTKNSFLVRHDVQDFIQLMVTKHHFSRLYLYNLFNEAKIRPQVMQNLRKPFEKQPWHTYQMLFITQNRIQQGVEFWNKYKADLAHAEKVYGVPASIIVATIGIETKYGKVTGDYRVLDALTNIAFSDSSRVAFFRRELEEFLLLTREQRLNPLTIMGSYAGAIGQPQFMPSSYRHYAVNFSHTGKTDLMHNEVDVIGSIANYYNKNGWISHAPVAVKALKIGDRYNYLLKTHKIIQPLTIKDLPKFGIIAKSKTSLPLNDDLLVKVIELSSLYDKEYWIGFHNFDVIKRYNASDLYAMTVYQLSNQIAVLKERNSHG